MRFTCRYTKWPEPIIVIVLQISRFFIKLLSPFKYTLRKTGLLKDWEYMKAELSKEEFDVWAGNYRRKKEEWIIKHPLLSQLKLWYETGIGVSIIDYNPPEVLKLLENGKLKTDDTDIQEIRMDAEPEGQGCEQHSKESRGE